MPSRREVDALARALRHISERAQADLGRVFDSLDWSDATTSKQLLVDAIMGISNTYSDAAGAAAAQWVEALLSVEPVLPDRVVRGQVEKRVGWSIAKVFSGDVDQARETTKQVVDHIVSSQGKRTVALTCGKYGVRFARVPKGSTTCEFCLMLASRGYVYESASTAGSISSFHASCDCQVVPEDGAVPDGYDPKALHEQWKSIKSARLKREKIARLNKRLEDRGLPRIGQVSRRHILDGEPDDETRGGHRFGTGRWNKTEFPESWSDDDVIIATMETMLEPLNKHDRGTTLVFQKVIDSVAMEVKVVARKNGETNFRSSVPRGGAGVYRNQRNKRTGGHERVPVSLPEWAE